MRTSSSLDDGDCLTLRALVDPAARPPYHHNEYELILLPDAAAITLTVGEETFSLEGAQLILTAPGLIHGWTTSPAKTIARSSLAPPGPSPTQLPQTTRLRTGPRHPPSPSDGPPTSWANRFLGKNQLQPIGQLLEKSRLGLRLPTELIPDIRSQLLTLQQKKDSKACSACCPCCTGCRNQTVSPC